MRCPHDGSSRSSSSRCSRSAPARAAAARASVPDDHHHDHRAAGGHLTVLAADDVDFVDPAETYYAFGYTVHYAVNRPLYSYAPGDAGPRPDLADGAPRVSADGRTVTVRLKAGIRYAPPVDREVTSKDVKYAFERAFSAHVASPYASLYFGDIVGAPAKPGPIADIRGSRRPTTARSSSGSRSRPRCS